jgi:hypothetical protein
MLLRCYTTENLEYKMRKSINRTSRTTDDTPPDRKAAWDAGARDAAEKIRNGVKTERDTQPVQVRMLKAQIKVLKQVAEQEDRTASDVIRDLVDDYLAYCLRTWTDPDKRMILETTLRQQDYMKVLERAKSVDRPADFLPKAAQGR